jgi:hypothetical protein
VTDTCAEVANALHWNLAIPRHKVTATMDRGSVILQGVVERAYQKSCAEAVVRGVPGVIGVKNEIAVCAAQKSNQPGMKLRLVIHTCSNKHVAQAALMSIGGELARRVAIEAARRGCSSGSYVAKALLDFEQGSDLTNWAAAEQVTHGADQPILSGLYFILDYSLRRTAASAGAECRTSGRPDLAA